MKTESIVLGGGCFWCLEAAYLQIDGVVSSISGYAGGSVPSPTSDAVYSGKTGHAEVVHITFDTTKLNLKDILEVFWVIHDPTTLNRQGHDIGEMYRSIILYANKEQKEVARQSIKEVAKLWSYPIVTTLEPLTIFYPAEEHHQNFFIKHPESAYCQVVINPKLAKLREKFVDKLK